VCYTVNNRIGLIVEQEEGEAMKKHRLRGVLLGVSLALLLAGGVALAAGLQVTADQDCFECGFVEDDDATISYTPSPYMVELTLTGHEPISAKLCTTFSMNGNYVDEFCQESLDVSPAYGYLFARCTEEGNLVEFILFQEERFDPGFWVAAVLGAFDYGEWLLDIEQEGVGSDQVTLILAEDCEAMEEEFVPEPGTIALLGSGLAGLAGYAALRWRGLS
jgi:hypothetical protein